MNKTPRRSFLKHAGQATAAGCLAGGLTAASTRIAIIVDAVDKGSSAGPVRWAIDELRRAAEDKGATCAVVASAAQAGDFQAAVIIGRQEKDLANEAFRLVPGKQDEKPAVRASASSTRGFVYAITELADRVQHGADPVVSLRLAGPIQEQPANTTRSIARAFVSEVEDKSWFYDRDYWRDYLSALVTNRFNRFSLAFGWGYDFPRGVVGDHLHFPYPYLLDVPGYKVRAVPLDDGERERNLEALRFIVEQTTARGLDFQLALWTHAYQWTDSPRAQHRIEGLTPETHAPYCRDALALLLKTCPGIQGLTMRVHGESGIPEGSYDFWRTVFQGIVRAGRPAALALGIRHAQVPVRSRNSSNTVIRRGIWTEFPLPSVGSPSTGIHNLRPEQKLHKHTERPGDHDQLPSA